jgi:type II secretory ATPase GspE/PulE/Tfp pilus assembly ATPase PilB-like protein
VSEQSPLVRFTNAILIAAIKKGADKISFRGGTGSECPIDFTIEGAVVEEALVPAMLFAGVVRRLAIMANLPVHAKGESAEGFIELRLGDEVRAWFALHVFGHGPTLAATLRRVTGPGPAGNGRYG